MHGAGRPRHPPNPNPIQPHGFSPRSQLAWGFRNPHNPKTGSARSLLASLPPWGSAPGGHGGPGGYVRGDRLAAEDLGGGHGEAEEAPSRARRGSGMVCGTGCPQQNPTPCPTWPQTCGRRRPPSAQALPPPRHGGGGAGSPQAPQGAPVPLWWPRGAARVASSALPGTAGPGAAPRNGRRNASGAPLPVPASSRRRFPARSGPFFF